MVSRSHRPIHGVGSPDSSRGAAANVPAPKTRSTTIVATEYARNPRSNADAATAIARNIRHTVTAARTICMSSSIVAPPAASTVRWCIGANGHSRPSAL
jgi:hypothetical protein